MSRAIQLEVNKWKKKLSHSTYRLLLYAAKYYYYSNIMGLHVIPVVEIGTILKRLEFLYNLNKNFCITYKLLGVAKTYKKRVWFCGTQEEIRLSKLHLSNNCQKKWVCFGLFLAVKIFDVTFFAIAGKSRVWMPAVYFISFLFLLFTSSYDSKFLKWAVVQNE